MTTATVTPPQPAAPRWNRAAGPTLADLLDRLGGVPASRVRMSPPPGTATEADAIHSKEWYGVLCELVEGTLVEKPMGLGQSGMAAEIIKVIGLYNDVNDLGFVGGEAGTFTVVGTQVRMPDVSFTLWSRLPDDLLDHPAPAVAPDLAVEVLSPSNTAREIELKRQNFFAGGTRLMWVFDPPSRTVAVYTPGQARPSTLTDADTLDGQDVLPGFSLAIGPVFDKAVRPSRRRPTPPDPAGRQPPPAP